MSYDYEDYWEDSEEERVGYYKNLYGKIRKFYNINQNERVLDVAGGSGQMSNYFNLKNVSVIDISDSGLKIAKNKYGYKTFKCDLLQEAWNTRGEEFDVAICNEFLEHIYFPATVLHEINKSVKKGGILYIGQPNMTPDGEHHVRRINYSYLKFILEESGFKIKKQIIVPKIISSKFSEIKKGQSISTKIKIGLGAFIGLFLTKKMKFYIARKIPNTIGGFYHIKAIKVN
ncbi:MAG: 2-polyprenyl-3-methyl-5-hydroxy-6-metoxy-1,4-benzoquinol methylase [Patescibacteria group bacterium]|jgi:2-polyprenyl-3-methyl-5-hydroxy-6-metoxy-1,4-benzoquinol methylase